MKKQKPKHKMVSKEKLWSKSTDWFENEICIDLYWYTNGVAFILKTTDTYIYLWIGMQISANKGVLERSLNFVTFITMLLFKRHLELF